MSNHFIITQKGEPGCPVGYTNVVLCPEFKKNIARTDYGNFDWYRFPNKRRALEVQYERTGPLCLVSLEGRCIFDIRGIGGREKMYAMSPRFFESAISLGASFDQIVESSFVDSKNVPLSSSNYRIATFRRFNFAEIADAGSSSFQPSGSLIRIQTLKIKSDFEAALFSIKDILPQQDSLICSSRARQQLETAKIKGIEFTDLREFEWPDPPPQSSASDLLSILLGEKKFVPML